MPKSVRSESERAHVQEYAVADGASPALGPPYVAEDRDLHVHVVAHKRERAITVSESLLGSRRRICERTRISIVTLKGQSLYELVLRACASQYRILRTQYRIPRREDCIATLQYCNSATNDALGANEQICTFGRSERAHVQEYAVADGASPARRLRIINHVASLAEQVARTNPLLLLLRQGRLHGLRYRMAQIARQIRSPVSTLICSVYSHVFVRRKFVRPWAADIACYW